MTTSWKTTLLGFGAGVLTLVAGGTDWRHALMAAGLAALGAASKDHDAQ